MKKYLKCILLLALCIVMVLPSFLCICNASTINPKDYESIYNAKETTNKAISKGGTILRVIQVIAVVVAFGALIIIGIKYMVSSPNEKAQVKEQLTAYAIGAVLIFAGAGIIGLIARFVDAMR